MIWCVDNDDNFRKSAIYALSKTGFDIKGFKTVQAMKRELNYGKPYLIISEFESEKISGIEVINFIKNNLETKDIPVMIITDNPKDEHAVSCLNLGADAYTQRPSSMEVMLATTKALLRRSYNNDNRKYYRVDDFLIDVSNREFKTDGKATKLTQKEFLLLKLLFSVPGKVFSREEIYQAVWEKTNVQVSRTVDIHVSTLRMKLKNYSEMIQSIRGVGYKFDAEKFNNRNF